MLLKLVKPKMKSTLKIDTHSPAGQGGVLPWITTYYQHSLGRGGVEICYTAALAAQGCKAVKRSV
jgi:hypothetical protein